MINRESLYEVKQLIGSFYEEVKSNSITEFIVWLDCKIERTIKYEKEFKDAMRQPTQRTR